MKQSKFELIGIAIFLALIVVVFTATNESSLRVNDSGTQVTQLIQSDTPGYTAATFNENFSATIDGVTVEIPMLQAVQKSENEVAVSDVVQQTLKNTTNEMMMRSGYITQQLKNVNEISTGTKEESGSEVAAMIDTGQKDVKLANVESTITESEVATMNDTGQLVMLENASTIMMNEATWTNAVDTGQRLAIKNSSANLSSTEANANVGTANLGNGDYRIAKNSTSTTAGIQNSSSISANVDQTTAYTSLQVMQG